jgi:hypothetical protein
MTIKNQHSISSHRTAIGKRNEVINKPIHSNLIYSPSIVANINSPILWKSLKPAFLRVFYYFKNHI